MKLEQKAIIDRAKREGLAPSELASELLTHDLLNSALGVIRGHAVAFKNMSEQQQDAAIQVMQDEFTKAVNTAVRIISSAGTKTVRMKLKKVAIGTNYQIQGVADRDEEHLHALCDKAQDQSDVLIVLFEGDYHQGLDAIQADRDQKDLPLGDAPKEKKPRGAAKKAGDIAAKVIELPPGLVDQAREFVTKFQNGTVAGLQNQLKIGMDKAKALHDALAGEGLLSDPINDMGDRSLSRKPAETEATEKTTEESAPVSVIKIDEALLMKAKTAVIITRRVSASFLKGELEVDDDTASALLEQLQASGVISEENEMGGRAILLDA